jgi:hypothetical protein
VSHYLRQAISIEAVEDVGPLLLRMIVQDMTKQIPPPALPFARWRGVPAVDPPAVGEVVGYYVDVTWPEVEYV